MESRDDLVRAELNADEKQDEILFKAGLYEMPSQRALVWKFLIVFGAVTLFFGLWFWAQVGGLHVLAVPLVPGSIMSALAIFLILLALGCLVAGIAMALSYRRDPYEMRPIR